MSIKLTAVRSAVVLTIALCLLSVVATGQNVTFCNSGLTGVSGTFGSIIVPAGAICALHNATINGSIIANAGSQLFLEGGVTVKGSIAAYKSAAVQVYKEPSLSPNTNYIYGSIGLVGLTGVPNENTTSVAVCGAVIGGGVVISGTQGIGVVFGGGQSTICQPSGGGNAVGGDVWIQNNKGKFFRVDSNYFGRNLLVTGNKGVATKRIINNQARFSILCSGNDQPLDIGSNSAPLLLGQCRP